jgi:hypothetical protein
MASGMLLLIVAAAQAADDAHQKVNSLYDQLRSTGVTLGGDEAAVLPPPRMPDGQSADEQRKVLAGLLRGRFPVDEFTRKSLHAPFVLDIGDLRQAGAGPRYRSVDLYFVIHGKLDSLADHVDWLQEFLRQNESNKVLTREQLAGRGIPFDAAAAETSDYYHLEFSVLDRVQVATTSHSTWSRTDESFLSAGMLDQRFADDEEFPNRWRELDSRGGSQVLGPPHSYSVSLWYAKVTPLAESSGALFLEYHAVAEQPAAWFGGADLIRSKLPIVARDEIRTLRRKVAKMD